MIFDCPKACAQTIEASVKIEASAPQTVIINGRFLQQDAIASNKNWIFLNSLSGVENLAERVSDLNLSGKNGGKIPVKKLASGEYLTDEAASFWNYRIAVNPPLLPQSANALAHVSWIEVERRGILMLDDLLPQFSGKDNQKISARVKFDLPKDWAVISAEPQTAENVFAVENVEKAIFFIGKNWREREIAAGKDNLSLAISGDFQFSDEEAANAAAEIFAKYRNLFGEAPSGKTQISIVRFPSSVKFGRWSAETRGANLTILSGDMPFKTQSLQRLHEQLRHEIFHLWTPNNLALSGNYDWFYEGFAVYQALKTGVDLNQIRFEDFLDTLEQAFNFDKRQTRKISLVEASKTNRSGANNQVYARGMLMAFLCDVALLRASRGKRSIDDILREIYRKHRAPNGLQDANQAVLDVLRGRAELKSIVEKYIEG
ncbi:MAG: hypothetical protein H0U87_00100, partial [Acidobacteria bacterium]|nr:hypothetical protein [Acidobacteriota bacterium]